MDSSQISSALLYSATSARLSFVNSKDTPCAPKPPHATSPFPDINLLHQLHSHLYHPNSYLFNHLRRIYHDFLFFPRRLDLVPYFWRYSTIAIFSQGQRQRVSFWKFFYCFSLQSPGREACINTNFCIIAIFTMYVLYPGSPDDPPY